MLDRFCRVAVRRPACVLVALVGLATSACTVGPKYQRPASPPLPSVYKEAPPAGYGDTAGWKEAQPNDGVIRGKWWEAFKDPLLNSLEEQVDVSNQNLKQFEAQYRSALAAIRVTRAGLFPTVTGGATATGVARQPRRRRAEMFAKRTHPSHDLRKLDSNQQHPANYAL